MTVTVKQICTPGYSKRVRNVPQSEKVAVFKEYGITPSGNYEIDHLISLELGGSNDAKNLWPESYLTKRYNAHTKDKLENRLHWLVCHASLPIPAAQQAISGDWIASYEHFVVQNATK